MFIGFNFTINFKFHSFEKIPIRIFSQIQWIFFLHLTSFCTPSFSLLDYWQFWDRSGINVYAFTIIWSIFFLWKGIFHSVLNNFFLIFSFFRDANVSFEMKFFSYFLVCDYVGMSNFRCLLVGGNWPVSHWNFLISLLNFLSFLIFSEMFYWFRESVVILSQIILWRIL